MSPAPRVVVVGDIVTDVLAVLSRPLAAGSDTPAAIRLTGGGQAANTAAWLAWRGHPVTLVGAVGLDQAGRDRVTELTGLGVRCVVRRTPAAPTGTVIVLADEQDRTMVTERGANLLLTVADVDTALAAAPDAGHLHLSGYPLLDERSRPAGRAALALARNRGLTTSVDAASAQPLQHAGSAAFRGWIDGVDLLLANADEAAVLTAGADADGDGTAQARELTSVARNVVVKQGAGGAVWATRDGRIERVRAHPAPVRDVTGAGDAFAAGLLARWVTGGTPAAALASAAELGAAAVATIGARPRRDADQQAVPPG